MQIEIITESDGSLTVNVNGGEITIGENMKIVLEEFEGNEEDLKNVFEESVLIKLLKERMEKGKRNDKERQKSIETND